MVWVSMRVWTCACVEVCMTSLNMCLCALCVHLCLLSSELSNIKKEAHYLKTRKTNWDQWSDHFATPLINDAECFQPKCFPLHFFITDPPFPHNLTGSGTGSLVLRLEKWAHEHKICHFESLHQLVKTRDGEGNKKRQRGRLQWYWAAARCEIVCECECGAGHDWKTAWSTINFYLLITHS